MYLIIYSCRFDGENFESIASSKCDHTFTLGLANYRGSPFVTGSQQFGSDCYVRTEIYNLGTDQWNDAPDYPYSRMISEYSVASTNKAAFVIGGRYTGSKVFSPEIIDVIAKYDDGWSVFDKLKKGRYSHGSILYGPYGENLMVIGGYHRTFYHSDIS